MRLSKNFSLEELIESDTAERLYILNLPNDEQLKNLQLLTTVILQPLRDALGYSIGINSGLRVPALNLALGGSKTSDHCHGLAADLRCFNNTELFLKIIELKLPFKQLIWEFGTEDEPKWVHVSLDLSDKPKRQILQAVKENGKTKYIKK